MTTITLPRATVEQALEALVQIYQRAATAETQALSDAVLLWSANADNTPESVRVEIQEVLFIRSSITALRAALAQQAGSWHDGVLEGHLRERERWLAQEQAKPVQEPVAWRVRRNDGQYELYFVKASAERAAECYIKRPQVEPLYTAPPQRKSLSLTDLQEALVLTNLIDRDAIDNSEEYDEGSTLSQIDELHRIIERAHGIKE